MVKIVSIAYLGSLGVTTKDRNTICCHLPKEPWQVELRPLFFDKYIDKPGFSMVKIASWTYIVSLGVNKNKTTLYVIILPKEAWQAQHRALLPFLTQCKDCYTKIGIFYGIGTDKSTINSSQSDQGVNMGTFCWNFCQWK
jgi:hypothetical protein